MGSRTLIDVERANDRRTSTTVKHEIINESDDELMMLWVIRPPQSQLHEDQIFAEPVRTFIVGRGRHESE